MYAFYASISDADALYEDDLAFKKNEVRKNPTFLVETLTNLKGNP